MDKQTLQKLLGIACIIIALFIAVSTAQHYQLQRFKDLIEKIDTTTTVDTLYYEKIVKDSVPYPKYITINKRDTVYVKSGDSIQTKVLELQAKKYSKTYIEKDDTISYSAEISGYGYEGDDFPKLDSIEITSKHPYYNTTTIIEKPIVYKQKFITTSPSITAGYDVFNKQWGAMIGVSVNFNIWNK